MIPEIWKTATFENDEKEGLYFLLFSLYFATYFCKKKVSGK